MKPNHKLPNDNRGATLVISLIMLVLLTLLALSGLRLSNSTLGIVGNMQAKIEVESQAEQILDDRLHTFDKDYAANLATNALEGDYRLIESVTIVPVTERPKIISAARVDINEFRAMRNEVAAKIALLTEQVSEETNEDIKAKLTEQKNLLEAEKAILLENCDDGRCIKLMLSFEKVVSNSTTAATARLQEAYQIITNTEGCQSIANALLQSNSASLCL